MTAYNTWMPGDQTYTYNGGASLSYGYVEAAGGGTLLAESFNVPTAQAGMGTTFDMVDPPFDITKPPKVCYSCTSAFVISLKDSDGWLWSAECPRQATIKERGWDWSQFIIAAVQDADKDGLPRPAAPAEGKLLAFQFQGAEGVHGTGNNIAQQIRIAYIAGRSPDVAQSGTIRTVSLLDRNPNQHTWKVGAVRLDNGSRRAISYFGTLPFGLMLGGPSRSRLAAIPYRGPYIAGYQSGSPWVDLGNAERLSSMLDFMTESQDQFRQRHPEGLLGPFMHAFLPATWDSEQTGPVDSWVFDAPDGNPAWNGWQYRAFDAMALTWSMASGDTAMPGVTVKLQRICLRFLTWIYGWMSDNQAANYIPSAWGPPGWTQGTPLPPDSYLDPHGDNVEPHDLALVLKGAIYCALAGADETTCKYVIARCVRALALAQVQTPTDPMRGAFTLNPAAFEVYSFHQGEILDALALAAQNPDLVPASVITPGTGLNPVLQLSEVALVFPETPLGASRTIPVRVTNVGGGDLIVLSTALSGTQFNVASGIPTLLQTGEYATIDLRYTPTEIGDVSGSFSIYSNDPKGPHTVSMSGSGKGLAPPQLVLSKTEISFPDTMSGSTARQSFTITNSGAAVLNITGMTVTGDKFKIVGAPPASIAAGQSATVSIDFAPTATGTETGEVAITSNASGSPHLVQMVGKGTPQAITDITWLTTEGALLRDANGEQVMLRSINWYGFEQLFVPGGMWTRPYRTITVGGVVHEGMMDEMKRHGFNSIRLLFSEDCTWPGAKPVTAAGNWNTTYIDADLNPDFIVPGTANPWAPPQPIISCMEIMDKIVAHAEVLGMRIILDLHCLAPDNDNVLGTGGKWYTTATPGAAGATEGVRREPRSEQQAIDAWVFLADRYKNRPVVCGADLINEPHNCTWDRDPQTGVVGYYERAGAAIQAVNPNMLIICEGVAELGMNNGTVDHTPAGYEGTPESLGGQYRWGVIWSGKLDEVARVNNVMVSLPVPNKVVYSPHEYASWMGSSAIAHEWFHPQDVVNNYPGPAYPENMFEVWRRQWGYLAEENIAPVWIGEFGSYFRIGGDPVSGNATSYDATHLDLDEKWISKLAEYCNTHSIGFAYWAWNPGGDPDGLLEQDSTHWLNAQQFKLDYLAPLLHPGEVPPDPGGDDGYRVTDEGDYRVTDAGDQRVIEE